MMATTAKTDIVGRLVVLPTPPTNQHNDDDDNNNQIDDGQVKVYQFDDDINDEVLLNFTNSLANDLNKSANHDKHNSWTSIISRRLFDRVRIAKKRYTKREIENK